MAVITISREFGSDGDLISQKVAESLNYSLVNKQIIERILSQYGMVTFNKVYNSDQSIWDRFDMNKNEMVAMLNQTIRAFAKLDNSVIVGRGGFIVLNGYENVLNVCIEAPFENRVSNIMKAQNITVREEAEAIVSQNDRVRKGFLQTYYNVKGTETSMFSMTINTGLISTDLASKWIIEAAGLLSQKKVDPKLSTSSIEIDPVLIASVIEINAELKS
jgi:cytidylate kinase